MINFEELTTFFNDFIKADSNPYIVISKKVYKENGEVKTDYKKEEIILQEVKTPLDILLNNQNIEYIDYYPKTFFKKLFNIKGKNNLHFEGDDSNFILMSENTQKIFKTNCNIHTIEKDDVIIIGKRDRLIYLQIDNKLFVNLKDNIKTLILR